MNFRFFTKGPRFALGFFRSFSLFIEIFVYGCRSAYSINSSGAANAPDRMKSKKNHFWEPPPEAGPLPAHGSDFGLFMHAEVLGMRRIVFVKDEDGLYTKDPKRHRDARLIERTTLAELLTALPEEIILDRELFTAWRTARHVRRVQIINGLRPGQLTRALAGEDVGTVIENPPVAAARRADEGAPTRA